MIKTLLQTEALSNAQLILNRAMPLLSTMRPSKPGVNVWEFNIGQDEGVTYLLALGDSEDIIYDSDARADAMTAMIMPLTADPNLDGIDLWLTFEYTDGGKIVGLRYHEFTWLSWGPDDPDMLKWADRLQRFAAQATGLSVMERPTGIIDGSHQKPKH